MRFRKHLGLCKQMAAPKGCQRTNRLEEVRTIFAHEAMHVDGRTMSSDNIHRLRANTKAVNFHRQRQNPRQKVTDPDSESGFVWTVLVRPMDDESPVGVRASVTPKGVNEPQRAEQYLLSP